MRLIGRSLCTIMIVVSFFVLSGCKALDVEFAYQLTLSESSIVFDMQGAEKSLAVAPFPEEEKWTAAYAEEEDWFTFEAVSDALLVTVEPNYSTDSRSGAIILSSPENHFEPYRVEVVQEGRSLSNSRQQSKTMNSILKEARYASLLHQTMAGPSAMMLTGLLSFMRLRQTK